MEITQQGELTTATEILAELINIESAMEADETTANTNEITQD